ncbi:MAG: NAD(P)H-dependent oxidoreductase [Pseudomonadota bacterium]
MSKLLYIKASPREGRSHSIKVADAFVEAYKRAHPKDNVEVIDLFNEKIAELDLQAVNAKYAIMHGEKASKEELNAWKGVEKHIEQFKFADKYLFAVPMWNFGIPYKLKQYIDIIVQPTYTFAFSPESGYSGLITGKPALAIYSRGGEYKPGTPAENFDFQKKYFEAFLGFIGFTDIRSIVVEPTLAGGPDMAKAKDKAAIEKAKNIAPNF